MYLCLYPCLMKMKLMIIILILILVVLLDLKEEEKIILLKLNILKVKTIVGCLKYKPIILLF